MAETSRSLKVYLAGELFLSSFEEGLPHRSDDRMFFHIAAHEEDIDGLFGGRSGRGNKHAGKERNRERRYAINYKANTV